MKTSRLKFLVSLTALAFSLSVTAACDDTTTTGGAGLDALAAQAVVDSVVTKYIDDNGAVGSLNDLGSLITQITSLQDPAPPFAGSPSRIPSALLGATCAWDTLTQGYFDDQTRRGEGPPDAVRFLFYTTDSGTGLPVRPLEETGWVDVSDSSIGTTIDVSIAAGDINGNTLLDYGISGTYGATLNLLMSGHLSDGVDQLTFAFDVFADEVSGSSSLAMDFDGFAFDFDLDFSETGGTSYMASLTDPQNHSIEVMLGFDNMGDVIAGSGVKFNDVTVAEFSGTIDQQNLVPVEGSDLTQQDIAALGLMFGVAQQGFFALDFLFSFGLQNTAV